MATTAIACELLTLNTRSSDLDPVNGGGSGNGIVATTPSDGWVISPPSGVEFANERLLLTLGVDASGDTFTIAAGNRFPAQRAGLGALTVTLAASDVRYLVVETSRFLKSNGTIVVTCTDAGSTMTAVMLPKAA